MQQQRSDDRSAGGDGSAGATAGTAAAATDALTISFRALQRCRTTIEDFCLTYFPLHGLKLPEDLFRYMDVLLYVEATIYQMDEENERAQEQRQQEQRQQQQSGGAAAAADDGGSSGGSARRGVDKEEEEEQAAAAFPAAAALEAVLRARGLWDDAIADELAAGYRYWQLERAICAAMARHDLAAGWRRVQAARHAERKRRKLGEGQQPGQQQDEQQQQEQQQLPPLPAPPPELSAGFTPADALAAHAAKSFDYRVLHRVLLKLAGGRRGGEPPDCCARDDNISDLLEFLRLDERLVDIGDDLTDYEDDVVAGGAFNVYRAFLHLYGPRAPLVLADHIGALEAARARALANLPKWQQDLVEARAEAAAGGRQGADKWVFPTPILNEAGFRRRVLADEAGGGERM